MSTENKLLATRWFDEVWNQGRTESIARMMSPECNAHGLGAGGSTVQGPEAFAAFQQAFLKAFPNLKITVEDVIAEDDKVAIRWRAAGTLKGEGFGVEPNGRSMEITGMSMVRIRESRIVDAWNNFDVLGIHQQLGTLPQLVK
jgi:steroid delta-isomerase-like uncharacterized protein